MKGLFCLISSFLLISCAALPAIRPLSGAGDESFSCPSPFVAQKTRFIHSIEARLAGETRAVMIGVTLADPATRTLSSAIMSTEGMVLFDAVRGPQGLAVNRALPPFDAADFARNMLDDIELIFLAPRGAPRAKGFFAEGNQVCRWHETESGWIDVARGREGRIYIRRYSESGQLKRSVLLAASATNSYATIEMRASEMVQYTLVMTLIESETVRDESASGNIRGSRP